MARAKTPCNICARPSIGGYCGAHQRNRNLSRDFLQRIYLRDGGICHLCHQPVSRRDASLDHKQVRADGGGDHPTNLALAHIQCNTERGTNPLEG